MRKHSEALGIGDLYGLLVCMVSGRSWDTILAGIQKTKYTANEVHRLKFGSACFISVFTNTSCFLERRFPGRSSAHITPDQRSTRAS